jgi:hypothetical protein
MRGGTIGPVPVPTSLRVARLLLFAAAAASFAVVVLIASRASAFSPLLLLFGVPIGLFIGAHQSIREGPKRARVLALAGAVSLSALAILTGFGAGDVSFPAAGIGVLATWSAWLHPPRRTTVMLFVAYVAIGLVVAVLRAGGSILVPFLIANVFLWPATILFLSPAALSGGAIFAGLGAALGLAAYAARDALPRPGATVALAGAMLAGVLSLALVIGLAYASPNSSARFELVPQALIAIFAGAFATLLGLLTMRRSPVLAGIGVAAGASILAVAAISRPTITCSPNGYSTSAGPWWLGPGGSLTGSGGGGSGGFSGSIVRGDGITIRYSCSGSTLTEFVIEEP